jgi:hypothetical protein
MSRAMSLADLPKALLQKILHQIALLLLEGAGGDVEAARHAGGNASLIKLPNSIISELVCA